MKYFILALATALMPLHAENRIVSLGGAITEIIYALGAGDQIVGLDKTSRYPAETSKRSQVGYARALSPEGVLSLSPNLVICTSEAGPPQSIEHLKNTGIEVLVLPEDHSLEGVKGRIRTIATRLDRKEAGEKLVAKIESAQTQLAAISDARPKTVFLMRHGSQGLMAAGKDTAAHAMLVFAGATNVADTYAGYKPLSAEFLAAAAPEIIVVGQRTLEAMGGMETLLENPALAITPAGRKQQVVAMDDAYLLSFGPRAGNAAVDLAAAIRAWSRHSDNH
jgi:iron complex transport system substrate-binding protein